MTSPPTLQPRITWSQRRTHLTLVIHIPNCTNATLQITDAQTFTFNGTNTQGIAYNANATFNKKVKESSVREKKTGQNIVYTIEKEKEEEYWERLLDGKAPKWLGCDFDTWKEEDEEETEAPAGDDGMGAMGGMGGMGGMPGMGGPGGMDMAKLMAQMGGAGGMGGMDMAGMGKADSDDEDGEDDGEMPPLEAST